MSDISTILRLHEAMVPQNRTKCPKCAKKEVHTITDMPSSFRLIAP